MPSPSLPARSIRRACAVGAVVLLLGVVPWRSEGQSLTIIGSASLVVNAFTPGGGLEPATDNATSYSVTTSAPNQRVQARLSCALPTGLTLVVRLSGATSTGNVTLTTTDADVLGPIPSAGTSNGTITYTLTATTARGPLATTPCSVDFTLL